VGQAEKSRAEARRLIEPAYIDVDTLIDDLEREIAVRDPTLFGAAQIESRPVDPEQRRIAITISGGGAAGAYAAGALETLLARMKARGIRIDLIVGASAGALNAYGVVLDSLGMANPQLREDPGLRQPYSSFIASIWSFIGRDARPSRWIAGRRAWMIDIATKGIDTPLKRWGLAVAVSLGVLIFNPFLLIAVFLFLGLDGWLPTFIREWGEGWRPAFQLGMLGVVSLAGAAAAFFYAMRAVGTSLLRGSQLLRLLANTGPNGDLSRPWFWPREQTYDRARVLSREIVSEWYKQSETAPQLVVATTDITGGRECMFTLVRPDTYRRLRRHGWMAVQLDAQSEICREYRESPDALLTPAENLLQAVLASTAVPSAFPSQAISLYSADGSHEVSHRFVDGGVLNNSPLHLAIDAGATHIISLEVDPLTVRDPLKVDDKAQGYNVLEAGVTTFTTLIDRAIERDVRRTVTWNHFLLEHPESLSSTTKAERTRKRILPLYRVAPLRREIGTVEFDGRYENGRLMASLRDVLRRGMLDLQGKRIWRATLQSIPDDEV